MPFEDVGDNTFREVKNDDPQDRLEVIVGDDKQADFKPQFKVQRWDNEVNISFRTPEEVGASVVQEGDKIKYVARDYEVHQYSKIDTREGSFELEIVLKKKPAGNTIVLTTEHKGLVGYKQLPLTEETPHEEWVTVSETQAYDADGRLQTERPEDIINSIAFYQLERGINIVDGKKYRVGKVGHLKRIKATDNNGDWIWGDMDWDSVKGELTITLDQVWLAKAVYPVIVDPNFGYEVAGGTTENITTESNASQYTNSAGSGNLNTIYCYYSDNGSCNGYAAIYTSAKALIEGKLVTANYGTTPDWRTFTMAGTTAIANSTAYWLAIFCDTDSPRIQAHFDSYTANGEPAGNGLKNGSPSAYPSDPIAGVAQNTHLSIYGVYSAAGGVETNWPAFMSRGFMNPQKF